MWRITNNLFKLNKKTASIFLFWVSVTSVAPFTFFCFPWHPYKLLTFFLTIAFFSLLFYKRNIEAGDNILAIIICIQISFFIFLFFIHNDSAYLNLVFQNLVTLVTYYFIINFIGLHRITMSFINIMLIMAVFGLLAFMLGLMGFLKPFSYLNYVDGRKFANYILTFSNAPFQAGKFLVIRVAGYFNEPGTFAFFIIQTLLLNKLSINNRKIEIVLIVAGFTTLSVAYFIVLFFYFLFFYFKRENFKYFVYIIGLVVLLVYLIDTYKTQNPVMATLFEVVLKRFEISNDPNKIIEGDNRLILLQNATEAFFVSPLFGNGLTYSQENLPYMGANFMQNFAYHGVIGFIIIFLHIFYLLSQAAYYKEGRLIFIKPIFFTFIILMLLYLQRPDTLGLFIYTFLILIIYQAKKKKKQLITNIHEVS